MTTYRIWLTPKIYVEIEAECPSKAIEQVKRMWIWKIEIAR